MTATVWHVLDKLELWLNLWEHVIFYSHKMTNHLTKYYCCSINWFNIEGGGILTCRYDKRGHYNWSE